MLHDPALSMTGDDDTGRLRRTAALLAATASGPARSPRTGGLTRRRAATSGSATGGPTCARTAGWTGNYTAPHAGNVVQVGRTRLTGSPGGQRLTLALGLAAPDQRPPARRRAPRWPAGSPAAARGVRGRLARDTWPRCAARRPALGRLARRRTTSPRWRWPRTRTRRTGVASSPRPAGPGHGRTCCSTCPSTTRCGHATSTRSRPACSPSGTGRGEPRAGLPVRPCSSGPTGRSRRTPGSTASRCSAGCRWTRSRSRSCWPGSWPDRRAPTGTGCAAPPTSSSRNGPRTPQERWENIGGYSPATIAAEIAGLICAADIAAAKRRGRPGRAGTARRRTHGSGNLDAQTLTTTGPLDPRPYYLRITDNGDADSGAHDPDRRRRAAHRPAPGRRSQLPGRGPARRQAGPRPGHPEHLRGRRPGAGLRHRRTGGSGTGPASTGTARSGTASQWEPVPTGSGHDRRPRLAAARRRARRVGAGRRAAGPARSWTRWPGPRTTTA